MHLSISELLSTTQQSLGGVRYGTFHHLERIIFDTRQEVHYKLCGVKSSDFITIGEEDGIYGRKEEIVHVHGTAPLQVVLRGASSLSVGVHVRMLQRCLKAIIFSLTGPHGKPSTSSDVHAIQPSGTSGDIHFNPPGVNNHPPSPPMQPTQHMSASTASNTVVPGAGAGELGWSLLWRQMAHNLAKRPLATPEKLSEPSYRPSEVCDEDSDVSSFTFDEKIQPLVDFLSDALCQRVGATYPEALSECASLCALLSDTYQQLPLQCVINSLDVLPDRCDIDRSGCDCGEKVRLQSPQAVLLHWEKCFRQAGAATGRVGLVVEADPLAE